jgi:signal transduction histidine kinase
VSVELENGNGLRLRVEDDGRGFSVDAAPRRGSGLGLVSMRERAEALGGRLTVASRPGEGTSVELVLP